MYLFGPSRTCSLGGKRYTLAIVDDVTRFTWIAFLATKYKAWKSFSKLYRKIENEKGLMLWKRRSDHGAEFENEVFENFCVENGIAHEFSAPRNQ